jgi:hypothetical protein
LECGEGFVSSKPEAYYCLACKHKAKKESAERTNRHYSKINISNWIERPGTTDFSEKMQRRKDGTPNWESEKFLIKRQKDYLFRVLPNRPIKYTPTEGDMIRGIIVHEDD